MQIELKRIQTDVGLTFVHVTHDQEEAMTMADTIAVMNRGAIEQLGPPADLYENPRTTFVANFLGQSNLLAGDVVEATLHGWSSTLKAPSRGGPRTRQIGAAVVCGSGCGRRSSLSRRPGNTDGMNVLHGGLISDVSFVGVSTQYVVRMPWGQELNVFEQNTGERPSHRPGARSACGGVRRTPSPRPRTGCAGRRGKSGHPAMTSAGRRSRAVYGLLLPGLLWLILFFVIPLYSLIATSLYHPAGGVDTGYQMTWHIANYAAH